jgi:hypothetical protein
MPPCINAFLPGESAQIADEQHLKTVLAVYRNGPAILKELTPKIGERVRILDVSFPHVAGVLYSLSGISLAVWQECLIDDAICDDDTSRIRASCVYTAQTITEAGESFVVIQDKTGRPFAKFWRVNPANAISEITEIASLRSRGAFEMRFHFDGDYENKRGGITEI